MKTTLVGFDARFRTRIVFGEGAVDRLGELARELGLRRVLLVTDQGVAAAGHSDRARRALESSRISVLVFDRARENPTANDLSDCAAVALEKSINGFVAVGGGSSMDTAKGANFLLTNGGRIQEYRGYGKARKPLLPLIAVPTTAGTGSECQSYALIVDDDTHQKMACGDPSAAPAIAVLDPKLTLSQPRQVTAMTGLDAVTHAVETAVTKKRTSLSRLYSREAYLLTSVNLPRVLEEPQDLAARARMQLGAAYAGVAIELSMLGAAHSAANPLTSRFGIAHGQAVGMMLPHVVRFNGADRQAKEIYRDLLLAAGPADGLSSRTPSGEGLADPAAALADRIEGLLRAARIPGTLAECGVAPDSVPRMAQEAAGQWTAQFNPRPVTAADFEALYQAALSGREVLSR